MKGHIFVIAALAGCAGGDPVCAVNGDCAANQVCTAEGACAALDGGPTEPGLDALTACTPNHDGAITRDEIVIVVPTAATFRSSGETMVDLVGTPATGDARTWNFAGTFAGDRDVTVETASLAGTWFGSTFSGGRFMSPLVVSGLELLAVYADGDNGAINILGAASEDDGALRTKLTYNPPLPAFEFPLAPGVERTGTTTLSGTMSGAPTVIRVQWSQKVDAHGELETPYGTFPVLRVRMDLTQTTGLVVVTTRTYAFVSECYGTVAKVTSRPYESAEDFTTAAEVSRLAP